MTDDIASINSDQMINILELWWEDICNDYIYIF